MSSAKSLEDKIKELCKDPEYAMALFLGASIPRWRDKDNLRNADHYGLDKKKLNEVLNTIDSLERNVRPREKFDEIMKEAASECVEKFSAELENISRKRIENLQDPEINALRYDSYIIKALMQPYFKDKIFKVAPYFNDERDELIESLCAIIQVDYEYARKFAKIEILAKTGIAFYYLNSKYPENFIYIVPPYAVKIIDELAKEIEDKLKKSVDTIRNFNDTKFLSVLLIALGNRHFSTAFEAVYGVDWYEYLRTIRFQDICNYGCVNYSIRNLIGNIIIDIVKSRFEKTYKLIEKALKEKGFEIIKVIEPKFSGLVYRDTYTILAVKPGQYRFAIHVMPFPQDLPPPYEKREVIILEGPVARLDYLWGYRGGDDKFVVVEMDKNFDNIITVIDNVKSDWSRELAEIFKSLNITMPSQFTITSPSQSPPITALSAATSSSSSTSVPISSTSLSDKGILVEIKSFQSRARDILEAVVAAVLKDLGFDVDVDVQIPTKDGANIEVDVWALKIVPEVDFGKFSIYVSCKNLNNDIGTPIIHQESGRVNQLQKAPNMKFIVASKFNDQAKKTAINNGFIPIEIGFKVDDSNAIDAYKKVYEIMNEIFTALAPKRLQQLAESILKVSEELRRVSDELSRLASGS